MSRPSENRRWLFLRPTARLLEVSPTTVKKLAAAGSIRVQSLPGLPPRYSREDIEALARDSVHRAAPPAAGRGSR